MPGRDLTIEEARRLPARHPDKLFLIVSMDRPGSQLMLSDLEMSLYPPSTRRNENLTLTYVTLCDQPWVIIHVPIGDRPAVCDVLRRNEMRMCGEGVVPVILERGTVTPVKSTRFPMSGVNVRTIEPVPGARVYDRSKQADLRKEFDSRELAVRSAWARSMPIHGTRVLACADTTATSRCTVCCEAFQPGDVIACIGDDPASGLSTEVHLRHLETASDTEAGAAE